MKKKILLGLVLAGVALVGDTIINNLREVKGKQKEVADLKARYNELIKEFEGCKIGTERYDEVLRELKECNNKINKIYEQQQ